MNLKLTAGLDVDDAYAAEFDRRLPTAADIRGGAVDEDDAVRQWFDAMSKSAED